MEKNEDKTTNEIFPILNPIDPENIKTQTSTSIKIKPKIKNEEKVGDYIIKNTIGRGAFGKVKLGIHIPTHKKVAIKILEKSKILENDDLIRVKREFEMLSKFNHPNVIMVTEIFETPTKYYSVMEYCKGGELFNYMVKKVRLTENESSFFFYQLINGLEYIHSLNIVHRDLKPENLLLNQNKILKIIDFGLSNYFGKNDNMELLITPCGSPCYASPEMINGNKYDGYKIDIWASGIILYAMLCGYLPFEGCNDDILFKRIVKCKYCLPKNLSDDSKDLISKILVTDPEKRISIKEIKKHPFYIKGKKLFDKKFENNFQTQITPQNNEIQMTNSISYIADNINSKTSDILNNYNIKIDQNIYKDLNANLNELKRNTTAEINNINLENAEINEIKRNTIADLNNINLENVEIKELNFIKTDINKNNKTLDSKEKDKSHKICLKRKNSKNKTIIVKLDSKIDNKYKSSKKKSKDNKIPKVKTNIQGLPQSILKVSYKNKKRIIKKGTPDQKSVTIRNSNFNSIKNCKTNHKIRKKFPLINNFDFFNNINVYRGNKSDNDLFVIKNFHLIKNNNENKSWIKYKKPKSAKNDIFSNIDLNNSNIKKLNIKNVLNKNIIQKIIRNTNKKANSQKTIQRVFIKKKSNNKLICKMPYNNEIFAINSHHLSNNTDKNINSFNNCYFLSLQSGNISINPSICELFKSENDLGTPKNYSDSINSLRKKKNAKKNFPNIYNIHNNSNLKKNYFWRKKSSKSKDNINQNETEVNLYKYMVFPKTNITNIQNDFHHNYTKTFLESNKTKINKTHNNLLSSGKLDFRKFLKFNDYIKKKCTNSSKRINKEKNINNNSLLIKNSVKNKHNFLESMNGVQFLNQTNDDRGTFNPTKNNEILICNNSSDSSVDNNSKNYRKSKICENSTNSNNCNNIFIQNYFPTLNKKISNYNCNYNTINKKKRNIFYCTTEKHPNKTNLLNNLNCLISHYSNSVDKKHTKYQSMKLSTCKNKLKKSGNQIRVKTEENNIKTGLKNNFNINNKKKDEDILYRHNTINTLTDYNKIKNFHYTVNSKKISGFITRNILENKMKCNKNKTIHYKKINKKKD